MFSDLKLLPRIFLFILTVSSLNLFSCPFQNFKKGRYQKKEVIVDSLKERPKDILDHLHSRYEIALSELQFTYPYDLMETKQQIHELANFLDHENCKSTFERRAVKKTLRCLKLIIDPNYKMHFKGKERYKQFVEALRLAIDLKEMASWQNNEVRQKVEGILQDISKAQFTISFNHTDIGYNYFWKIMPQTLAELSPDQLSAKVLNKVINKIFPLNSLRVFFGRLSRKLCSPLFISWDGCMATIRSKMASYHWKEREVSLLRMSCPVYWKNYRCNIDPIFKEYLGQLKRNKKKHLYISSLNTTTKVYSREYRISRLLMDFANQPSQSETLLFVTLPVDSAFYKQGNLGLLRASYFKEVFLNSMLLKQEGFYFPPSLLKNAKFIDVLDQIIEEIHKTYFQGREFLERMERCQFIDIAYAYIAKHLIEENNIDMVSWTCYVGIDRVTTAVAVFDVLLQSISQAPINLDSTIYLASWPAMLFYHRHPQTQRTVRCYSAIQKLLETTAPTSLLNSKDTEVKNLSLID